MKRADIIRLRLHNQMLLDPASRSPSDVVRWLGAIQSQDYAGARWALAIRMKNPSDAAIEASIDQGEILRTHVLRPTWHFVSPEDIRWMIELTEPRISAFSAKGFRDLNLDEATLKRSNKVIAKALKSGAHLTRKQLGEELRSARIDTNDLRLTFITFRAELDQIICSGARSGKQFTYALLEQRAPHAKRLQRDEALAELALRYFRSRGPASTKDFSWWSGLSPSDSKRAVEIIKTQMDCIEERGQMYYFFPPTVGHKRKATIHLLPSYDEYTVAYKDRSLVIPTGFEAQAGHGIFNPNIVVNGLIKGSWRREPDERNMILETRYFAPVAQKVNQTVLSVAKRYAKFFGKELTLRQMRKVPSTRNI